MSAIVSFQLADVAGLREKADLVERLLASGAITETEGTQLLNQFWAEHQTDGEARARRARFAPTADYHIGEDTMNANDIVTQIEQTHTVMSAQVRELNKLSPKPFPMPAVQADGTSGFADILHATVAGHITSAADSLRAIAEVEAAMRATVGKTSVAEPCPAPGIAQIIDAEFREMK
ncbi:MAG: hypothetical protein J5X21_06875 [Candidatus Accumulibacter sp.]|nr:hypothetical protein [Candidatus Accumulibacter conexus]